jgi:diguanylate cyclase (GGDEF)-like protein
VHSVVLKSALVTTSVIAVGQVLSFWGRMATGQEFTLYVFIMNSVLPLVTAMPASLLIFWQQHRLSLAHSALLKAHEDLAVKAARDHLTGLLNRGTFLDRVGWHEGEPGVLLIIDADNFKKINDTFGHAEGDAALRLIAAAIQTPLTNQSLAGRLGGEEFAVFVPGASSSEGLALAEALRAAVAAVAFYPVQGAKYPLSVSIGFAMTAKGADLLQTFRQADTNLYQAKANGRNAVVGSGPKPQLTVVQ